MLPQFHEDPEVCKLLNDIPRRSDGTPVNERCRHLDRLLKFYKYAPADLAFFREEISREGVKFDRAQRQRRDYLAHISRSEPDVPRATGPGQQRG